MPDKEPMPDFNDRAPRDRYCDLILTGGVTSAIAYPAAVATLATTYRFNSIGGSSSGAGAAALAAAAEYRRRHGSSEGFRTLLRRTAAVSDTAVVAGEKVPSTALQWLFQPAAHNKRLFDALVPGFASPTGKAFKLAGGLLRAYGKAGIVKAVAALCALLLLALVFVYAHGPFGYAHAIAPNAYWLYSLAGIASLVAGFVLAALLLLLPVIVSAILFWRDLKRVVDDDFGMCSGFTRLPGAPHPTLVEWLHDLIQDISGRGTVGPPLTFADLARAPGAPQETMGDHSRPGSQSIRLQMFTANVTQGRPYLFPQEAGDPPLYFHADEMRRLFPAIVVDHMVNAFPNEAPREDGLRRMPTDELPIVVAARLSVSFPVLFSAVPLWTMDPESKPPRMRRCLFSDGGLCSNFPIHLFDSPIPGWPTFGISLHEEPWTPSEKLIADFVTLPETEREGQQERWHDFGDQHATGARLAGFLGAMFNTVIDWNDATLARLPGVWDRVVRVGLKPGIGGLNILMSGEDIEHLGALGGEAGRRLLARFAKPSDGADGLADGWNEHRWMRFNLLRECLAEALSGVGQSAAQRRYTLPITEQIRGTVGKPARRHAPAEPPEPLLLAAQAAELEGVLAALMQVERALNAPTAGPPFVAHPRPQLRVRPPL